MAKKKECGVCGEAVNPDVGYRVFQNAREIPKRKDSGDPSGRVGGTEGDVTGEIWYCSEEHLATEHPELASKAVGVVNVKDQPPMILVPAPPNPLAEIKDGAP